MQCPPNCRPGRYRITLAKDGYGPKWIECNLPASAQEIIAICRTALSLGIDHLDMYGYRIGDYRATRQQMHELVPPEPAQYRITRQFPQKFLYDRPKVKDELSPYLQSLNP